MQYRRSLSTFGVTAWLLFCALSVNAQSSSHLSDSDPVQEQQAHSDDRAISPSDEVVIPGPLRSFLRMAGISQKASPEDVLPLLARNVYVQGYQGWEERGRPTEFLILLQKYLKQAKELAAFAGPENTIHVSTCEQAAPLL